MQIALLKIQKYECVGEAAVCDFCAAVRMFKMLKNINLFVQP